MKRPSPEARIGPEVKWTGRHYQKLSREELDARDSLRRQIKEEGVLDAHQEFLRRLPKRVL